MGCVVAENEVRSEKARPGTPVAIAISKINSTFRRESEMNVFKLNILSAGTLDARFSGLDVS